MVEPFESIVEGVQRVLSEHVLPHDVTEIQECIESLDDVDRDITLERGDKDLFNESETAGTLEFLGPRGRC